MHPCFSVQFETPKKVALSGLWFGPEKPEKVVIWVHGLGSSLWKKIDIAMLVTDKKTAVLAFNNRGTERVVTVKQNIGKKGRRIVAGAAHEKFTDCVDDIQGAVDFARKGGVKSIYLAGHSTGCQKSIYWAYKKQSKGVKGIILLAPVSDYASASYFFGANNVKRATSAARLLVKQGKPHELLPTSVWENDVVDAQRFLSLYTADSVEEIFTYADPKKKPRALHSVKVPILVLWAGDDQFADRPAGDILTWFNHNIKTLHGIVAIAEAPHSFKGSEREVATVIREFIS